MLAFICNHQNEDDFYLTSTITDMDAIHIATSIYYNCDIFLTNDAQLKQVSEANILLVDDM